MTHRLWSSSSKLGLKRPTLRPSYTLYYCFTCDYSRMRIIYFLKEKSETAKKIQQIVQLTKTQLRRPLKVLYCNGGGESDNAEVRKIMSHDGIILVSSNPSTPSQNGCAEHTNRTVVDLGRTMILAKDLPKNLCAEASDTPGYILNRARPSSFDRKTPCELFTGKQVYLKNFHVFGTEYFVNVPKEKRMKPDPKGKAGILIGYSDHIAGFVWLKGENHVIRSNDVWFTPENVGKLIALFPDKSNEQIDAERGECVLRSQTRSNKSRSDGDFQPEIVANEQSNADDSSEDQSWETPPSASPSPPRK